MLLTCPTCGSGLQVPDGTTAHVRCPACKAVFPAADGVATAEPVSPPPPPRPVAPRPAAPPRRTPDAPVNRDFDPEPEREPGRRAKRRRDFDSKYTPEERALLRAQFTRGMWGCRLISGGYGLQAFGLFFVVLQLALSAFGAQIYLLLGLAAVCGVANLVLVPAGLGLVLASRPAPGVYRFGIPACVAVVVHGVFVLVVLLRTQSVQLIGGGETVSTGLIVMGELVTKLNALTTYLLWVIFHEETRYIPQTYVLDLLCGLAEMTRLILVMVTLAGVARATGDKELVHRCVRAAGIGSFGPAGLAVVMPLYVIGTFVASQLFTGLAGMILLVVGIMGIYAILAGTLVPASVAAREAADACEFPFQSEIVT